MIEDLQGNWSRRGVRRKGIDSAPSFAGGALRGSVAPSIVKCKPHRSQVSSGLDSAP